MTIEINNESAVEVDLERARNLAQHVIGQLRLHPAVDLGIVFIDEDPMTELHVKWMDEPGPTDVLSFPMDELRPGVEGIGSQDGILGDVVICPQVAQKQALAAGHEAINEVLLLLTHGILHLVGFDHAEPEEEAEMFGLQRELLQSFYDAESDA